MSNFLCDRCQRTITDNDPAYAVPSGKADTPIALICAGCECTDLRDLKPDQPINRK